MKEIKNKIIKFYNETINFVFELSTSVTNFLKSSFLSILLLAIIFLLVSKMEQTTSLLVAMLESKEIRAHVNLFFSFVLLSALAILISHYPIYIYYALGINNSDEYIKWNRSTMGKNFPLNKIPIYTFEEQKDRLHITQKKLVIKKIEKNI